MSKVFFFLFAVVAIVIGFIVFIVPDYKALNVLKAEVVALEENIEVVKSLELSREALDKQRLSISQSDMQKLEKIVPSSPDNIRLIIQLDEIAKRNGLTMIKDVEYEARVAELAPGQVEDNPTDYRSYNISFNTSGQYNQFVSFLQEVEKNMRLVDITSLTLKNSEKEGVTIGSSQDFSVELKAYWLSEQSYE
jgi:Tfp pilus assembly protein PilO